MNAKLDARLRRLENHLGLPPLSKTAPTMTRPLIDLAKTLEQKLPLNGSAAELANKLAFRPGPRFATLLGLLADRQTQTRLCIERSRKKNCSPNWNITLRPKEQP